jgi:hypothetical protein
MEMQGKGTEAKRPFFMNVIYGILIIIIVLAAIILVAKFAFNTDLVNFDQLMGARISKTQLIKLQ